MKRVLRYIFFSFCFFCWSLLSVYSSHEDFLVKNVDLVNKNIDELKEKKNIFDVCAYLQDGLRGSDTRLVLLDENDIVVYFDQEYWRIWKKFPDVDTVDDRSLIKLIHEVEKSGGWVDGFMWNDSLVNGYFKGFEKDGKRYILGAISFVENERYNVLELVFRAASYFKQYGRELTLIEVNNPSCSLLYGTFSIEIYDKDGVCLADSYDITHVGRIIKNWVDENDQNVFAKIRNAVDNPDGYGWTTAVFFDGLEKQIFALKIDDKDKDESLYFVSSFFPDANSEKFVLEMANKAKNLLEKNPEVGIKEINNIKGEFNRARIFSVVYDLKGNVLADAKRPFLKGDNIFDKKDAGGFYIFKEILKVAQSTGSDWVFKYQNNAAELNYVEKININYKNSDGLILSVNGLVPVTKRTSAFVKAEWLSSAILSNSTVDIFRILNSSKVVKGLAFVPQVYSNLFIEIYDAGYFCVLAGADRFKIWDEMDSKLYKIIQKVESGEIKSGWLNYDDGRSTKYFYLKLCEKSEDEKFWILVGYSEPNLAGVS